MNRTEKNIEDAEIIRERINYYLSLEPEKLMELAKKDKSDQLHSIPHPDGFGLLLIGREGNKRFISLAERWKETQKEKKLDVDLNDFVGELKVGFAKTFIFDQKPIIKPTLEKLLNRAYKQLSSRFDQLTHFVPCSIVFHKNIPEFWIGPVRFLQKDKFLEIHQERLNKHKKKIVQRFTDNSKKENETKEEQEKVVEFSEKYANNLVDNIFEFFGGYDWVAEVTIPPCNKKVSKRRAIAAVEGAINVLKLILGEYHSRKMSVEYYSGKSAISAGLACTSDGSYIISVAKGAMGNLPVEEWLETIGRNYNFFINEAARVIHCVIDPIVVTYLSERYIDALSWYGQAVSERAQAAKLIKYVIAMERICLTGEQKGITEILLNRATTLYISGKDKKEFEKYKKNIKEIYDARSGLVHGSLSPFDDSMESLSSDAGEIAREVLLYGLDLYCSLGIKDSKFTIKKLKTAFEKEVSNYK